MATAPSSPCLSTPRGTPLSNTADVPKTPCFVSLRSTKLSHVAGRRLMIPPVRSSPTPPEISERVEESIAKAKETCAESTDSGECAAAWDEVEELSAAASHARDKVKDFDPLETYCKDNPETIECRTYED